MGEWRNRAVTAILKLQTNRNNSAKQKAPRLGAFCLAKNE